MPEAASSPSVGNVGAYSRNAPLAHAGFRWFGVTEFTIGHYVKDDGKVIACAGLIFEMKRQSSDTLINDFVPL
ncbi:hypothetical protein [Azospirillum sp. TSH64]|uniref:hypothetical protein n=1 Tax=Azospirillum sp. TSH64 TaxID=652740 RepID=UPI0011B29E1C|nr:hypothetical protein [Azospirillum sp. TSH64]